MNIRAHGVWVVRPCTEKQCPLCCVWSETPGALNFEQLLCAIQGLAAQQRGTLEGLFVEGIYGGSPPAHSIGSFPGPVSPPLAPNLLDFHHVRAVSASRFQASLLFEALQNGVALSGILGGGPHGAH